MKQKDDEKVVAINKAKDKAEDKPIKRKRNRPDLAKFGYENARKNTAKKNCTSTKFCNKIKRFLHSS